MFPKKLVPEDDYWADGITQSMIDIMESEFMFFLEVIDAEQMNFIIERKRGKFHLKVLSVYGNIKIRGDMTGNEWKCVEFFSIGFMGDIIDTPSTFRGCDFLKCEIKRGSFARCVIEDCVISNEKVGDIRIIKSAGISTPKSYFKRCKIYNAIDDSSVNELKDIPKFIECEIYGGEFTVEKKKQIDSFGYGERNFISCKFKPTDKIVIANSFIEMNDILFGVKDSQLVFKQCIIESKNEIDSGTFIKSVILGKYDIVYTDGDLKNAKRVKVTGGIFDGNGVTDKNWNTGITGVMMGVTFIDGDYLGGDFPVHTNVTNSFDVLNRQYEFYTEYEMNMYTNDVYADDLYTRNWLYPDVGIEIGDNVIRVFQEPPHSDKLRDAFRKAKERVSKENLGMLYKFSELCGVEPGVNLNNVIINIVGKIIKEEYHNV